MNEVNNYKIGVLGTKGHMAQLIKAELMKNNSSPYTDSAQNAHCLIDFTAPEALEKHLTQAQENNQALVIGTTGLSPAQEENIREAAQHIPILYSANMSLGVNLLLALTEQVAAKLSDEYDIEITEQHHRRKVDSPSGTALALGKSAAKGRAIDFDARALPNTGDRSGARKKGDIGFSVLRGGDIPGTHTVGFYGLAEHIELTHRACDRTLFASGAVTAALWLRDKPAGLYSMRDVLGL